MEDFKKGDILIGQQRSFDEAYHPIVYISGPNEAPLAVVLTHSNKFPCNMELLNIYGREDKVQYFVAHLIEKIPDWGPYEKIGELNQKDFERIWVLIKDSNKMTWSQYEDYTKGKVCPDHQ
jgi:hypothetical protein